MRVVVTGSSGCLARALLPQLCEDARIERVLGIDLAPPTFAHDHFRALALDIRDPQLGAHLAGYDALIHLAFVVMQGALGKRRRDRALVRAINIDGSRNVFSAASRSGVRTGIHLSSAAVYSLPSSTPRMDEGAARAGVPGFIYSEDKAALEGWLDGFEHEHRAFRLIRLRPHVILGAHAQPLLKTLLRRPLYPRLPEPAPLTQCVHEDDVAAAILLALFAHARGAFNLACADAASFADMQRNLHRHPLPVPLTLARAGMTAAWHLAGWGTDPGWMRALPHALVLDTTRARRDLGWHPRYDTIRDCIASIDKGGAHGQSAGVHATERQR